MANFLDTYDGTGDLGAHTSDSGHSYPSGSVANLVLDGAGALTTTDADVADGSWGSAVSNFATPESYTMTVIIEIGAQTPVSGGSKLQMSLADSYGTGFEAWEGAGSVEIYLLGSYYTVSPGVHTLTIVRQDGQTGRTINGGTMTWAAPAAQPSPGSNFGFWMERLDDSLFKVRSIQIDDFIIPPFWTANIIATETSS